MSIDVGITGLAKSGKTTVFNALNKSEVDTGTSDPHIGTVKVPEPRLQTLANMLQPKRVVPVEVKYTDIGAPLKTIGGQLLTQLSNVDVLINIVRAFTDESIPHIEGSLDIDRDIATTNLELAFSDLAIIERRLGRIETSMKGAKPPERQSFLREQELLAKIKSDLEKDVPIRESILTTGEARTIANYQFLTAKPLLIVVNIGEEELPQAESIENELDSKYSGAKCRLITLCGKLEMELSQLDSSAADNFRAEFCMQESGPDRTIKLSYELLGLISFFSIASGEVKAWSIPDGADAVTAAGKIHSDMERGFIRAEVISYDNLRECGSISEARKKGLLRLEGKNYTVKDGDVITFLFNV